MIVANYVTMAGAGINADTKVVKFLYADGQVEELAKMSKDEVARELLDRVLARRQH